MESILKTKKRIRRSFELQRVAKNKYTEVCQAVDMIAVVIEVLHEVCQT